ncbi:unnamed protein product [Mortierella alpina]
MRLNTCILALALVASTQVLAEEVTLGVWHKMSDSESFEKRGEIRLDAEEWLNHNQQRDQPLASSTQSSKQKYQKQQQQQQSQQSQIVYQNAHLEPLKAQILAEDFVLNVQAPIKAKEFEEAPAEPERDEDGNITETEEEFQQRLEEWKAQKEDHEAQDPALRTAGSYGFYQIKLRDESRNWEAMSSIKSCLLVASDFQEKITLHLDQNREVFAFDYYTSTSECEEEHQKEFPLKTLDHFKNVSVDLVPSQSGPKARYARAQGIKMDETGNPAVEKTFFQKYWVYIVPIVLVMLLTGGEPEKTAA